MLCASSRQKRQMLQRSNHYFRSLKFFLILNRLTFVFYFFVGEPLSDDDLEDLAATNGSSNPLLDLQLKLDEEKAALLRMLSNQDNQ